MHGESGETAAIGLGGTANLAVLGGNLPPSRRRGQFFPLLPFAAKTVGLVAQQNGQVARSTQNLSNRLAESCRKVDLL